MAAEMNGFNTITTGCPVIIGDGLKGTDDVEVPIVGGQYLQTARIGRAVMDADIVISLNHFKGHEMTGFGGAMKNLGMGCGSRAGKMAMHNAGKPNTTDDCVGCGSCQKICAHDAPQLQDNGKMFIDHDKCVGCGRCIGVCPVDAIVSPPRRDVRDSRRQNRRVHQGRGGRPSPTSTSPWSTACPPTAIATRRTTPPLYRMWVCSPALIRWPSTRPAVTRYWPSRDCKTPGLTITATRPSRTCSQPATPTPTGGARLTTGVKIGLGTDQYELIRI